MIPVPPLDGSKVLANLLPPDKAFAFSRIEPYGFMILIVLIMTGVIHKFVSPLVFLTVGLLVGGRF
jgi:Zn-dependent protease